MAALYHYQLDELRYEAEIFMVMFMPEIMDPKDANWFEEVESMRSRLIQTVDWYAPRLNNHLAALFDDMPLHLRIQSDPQWPLALFREADLICQFVYAARSHGIEAAKSMLADDEKIDDSNCVNRFLTSEIWYYARKVINENKYIAGDRTSSESEPPVHGSIEDRVRAYIRDCLKNGIDIQRITRDGVASALNVSGGAVSNTKPWKGLAAEKKSGRLPESREGQAMRLAKRGDRRGYEQICRESTRKLSSSP